MAGDRDSIECSVRRSVIAGCDSRMGGICAKINLHFRYCCTRN